MKTDITPPTVIASGIVSELDGLRDFLEAVVSSSEIKRSIICVESSAFTGELGIFCSKYIIGARLRHSAGVSDNLSKINGFEAIRQIFSLRDGNINQIEASADDIAQLRTSVAIDIFSLLDWAGQNSAGPPSLEAALDGVVESFAQTMTPMESSEASQISSINLSVILPGDPASDSPDAALGLDGGYTGADQTTGGQSLIGYPESAGVPAAIRLSGEVGKMPELPGSESEFPQGSEGENNLSHDQLQESGMFLGNPIDAFQLSLIPTPKNWNPFGGAASSTEGFNAPDEDQDRASEFWKKRRVSAMSEKDQNAVWQIYKDGQRTDRVREFIKVKKEKPVADDPLKFEHKGASDYVTRLNVALVVAVCIGTIAASLLLNHLMANAHDHQMSARGAQRLSRGESLGALLDFDSVVAHNGRSAQAYIDRASAYMALGDCENAANDYRKARENDPKDSRAYIGEASAILKRYDYTNAMILLNQALRLAPGSSEALTLRAIVAASLGKYEQTISDASKAIGSDPNAQPELYEWRAFAEWKSGKYKEALQDYDKAIDATTSDAQVFLGRGSCYLALGQTDRAMKDLHRAISIDAKLAEAFTARGKAYTSKEEYKNALADLTQAIELQRTSETYVTRGQLHARFREDGKAIADFDRALALAPGLADVEAQKAAAYSRVRHLKPIMSGDRPVVEPPLSERNLAKTSKAAPVGQPVIGQQSTPDPLTAVLTDALRGSPNDTKSRRYLAYTFMRNGNYKAAVEQFKMLADAHSLGQQDQLSYADALAHKGDTEQSIYIYKQVFDRNPYDRVARSNLIKLYMQEGRSFEAAALRSGVVTAGSAGPKRP